MIVLHFSLLSYFCCVFSEENLQIDATVTDGVRFNIVGKLLHVQFKQDEIHQFKHVRLWLYKNDSLKNDIVQVVCTSKQTMEWNESTLLGGQLLYIQDVAVNQGSLFFRMNSISMVSFHVRYCFSGKEDVFSCLFVTKIQKIFPQSSQMQTSLSDVYKVIDFIFK